MPLVPAPEVSDQGMNSKVNIDTTGSLRVRDLFKSSMAILG